MSLRRCMRRLRDASEMHPCRLWSYLENFPAYIRNTATDNYKELLNELNQRNFFKQHQWFGMPYIYVIRHPKRTGYYLKYLQCYYCHRYIIFNKVVLMRQKALKPFYEKAPFLMKFICKNLHSINQGST